MGIGARASAREDVRALPVVPRNRKAPVDTSLLQQTCVAYLLSIPSLPVPAGTT